jgi:hypothetical protein
MNQVRPEQAICRIVQDIAVALRAYGFSGEAEQFDTELREASGDATMNRSLDRWWGIACLRQMPPTEAEEELLDRARVGDFSGLYQH